MPRLWSGTLEAHRREVREAVIATTTALVGAHGLRAVTMAQIAEGAGIGRATLYKYFTDVDSILEEWHADRVREHLDQLSGLARTEGTALERLTAVLRSYALGLHEMSRLHHGADLTALVRSSEQVGAAKRELTLLIEELVREAVADETVRVDPGPEELAVFCLCALEAARLSRSTAAVGRLVGLVVAALGQCESALPSSAK